MLVRLCFILTFSCVAAKKTQPSIADFRDCVLPSNDYDPDSGILHALAMTKKKNGVNAVAGLLVVKKKTGPISSNLRSYKLTKTGRKHEYDVSNASCKKTVTMGALKLLNLKYNKDDCTLIPGNYSVSPIAMEDFRPRIAFTADNYQYEFEIRTLNGVALCFNVTAEI